jgi:hypothetical protein
MIHPWASLFPLHIKAERGRSPRPLGIGADDLYWLNRWMPDDLGAMAMSRWTNEPWLGATKVHIALRHYIKWNKKLLDDEDLICLPYNASSPRKSHLNDRGTCIMRFTLLVVAHSRQQIFPSSHPSEQGCFRALVQIHRISLNTMITMYTGWPSLYCLSRKMKPCMLEKSGKRSP